MRRHVPQLDQPTETQETESERQNTHRGLSAKQQALPIKMIGRESGDGHQENLRPKLERHYYTNCGCVIMR